RRDWAAAGGLASAAVKVYQSSTDRRQDGGRSTGGNRPAGPQTARVSMMESVSILDGIVLVVVLVSALLAMYRGFMRELFSIGSWVIAAVVAYMFY
ncbi:CvpA family protein, partial [Mycobacterium tuberculosis]|nr:CvpA family protein [Mycobacterium tuberculosis]